MERFRLREQVSVRYWDCGVHEVPAVVEDASPDGLFLQVSGEIPGNRPLEVIFTLAATLRSPGVRFVCRCRIVRSVRMDGKTGIAAVILRTESERISEVLEPVGAQTWQRPAMAD
jgi:hypothetical protein